MADFITKKEDTTGISGTETVKETLLSLLFPRRCPVCHDITTPRGAWICEDCRGKLSYIKEPTCSCCGKEIISWEMDTCFDCSRAKHPLDRGVSLLNYDAAARDSMAGFKHRGRQEYADFYVREIWRRYGRELDAFDADAIVPVPLHIRKERERGYNQALCLARKLSYYSGVPVRPELLVRTGEVPDQKSLNAAERRKNLRQVFAVGKTDPFVSRVILVDDIYTTGSTLAACADLLRKAGVSRVLGVTVCIGRNHG